MKIVIDLELSPLQKKVVRAAVVFSAVIGALGVGLAIASPIDSTWIKDGKAVSATSLASNVTELDRRTLATSDAGAYSVGATKYCGQSASAQSGVFSQGNLTGYPAAKAACAAAPGCSATAHMCSGEELSRSAQLGVQPPVNTLLWFSMMSYGALNPVSRAESDCSGWTFNADSSQYGGAVSVDSQGSFKATVNACSAPLAIACCD